MYDIRMTFAILFFQGVITSFMAVAAVFGVTRLSKRRSLRL
jgi:hypothetical protein